MPRAAAQPSDRRSRIARALYRCIREKGYANTSLRDVADAAEMSPSHVGYYFDNKAAILEYYGALVCDQNLAALPDADEPDLERRIDDLARFCLGPGQTSAGLLGVIQELTGLAVHDPRLHAVKARHTEGWRAYLERFFDDAPLAPGLSAGEAARLAHAMLVGLNTNTLFDSGLSRERAHETFRQALRGLVGLREGDAPPARRRTPPARQRARRARKEPR